MSIAAWIVTGLIAGLLARWVVRDHQAGCLYTIAVGVLGGLIGGAIMQATDRRGIDEFSARTVIVAALGACLFLLVLQALGGRRRSRRHWR